MIGAWQLPRGAVRWLSVLSFTGFGVIGTALSGSAQAASGTGTCQRQGSDGYWITEPCRSGNPQPPPPPPDFSAQWAYEANERGRTAFDNGDYDTAIEQFVEAYGLDRDDLYLANEMLARSARANAEGNRLYDAEDYDAAIVKYREALGYYSDSGAAAYNLGLAESARAEARRNAKLDELESEIRRRERERQVARLEERLRRGRLERLDYAISRLGRSDLPTRDLPPPPSGRSIGDSLPVLPAPSALDALYRTLDPVNYLPPNAWLSMRRVTAMTSDAMRQMSETYAQAREDGWKFTTAQVKSEALRGAAGRVPALQLVRNYQGKRSFFEKKVVGLFEQGMEGAQGGIAAVGSTDGGDPDAYWQQFQTSGRDLQADLEGKVFEEVLGGWFKRQRQIASGAAGYVDSNLRVISFNLKKGTDYLLRQLSWLRFDGQGVFP